MLETYRGTLHGDKIKWNGEIPDVVQEEAEIEVFVTILPKDEKSQKLRPFGLCQGEFTVPEDFDEPLPEEILSGFEKRNYCLIHIFFYGLSAAMSVCRFYFEMRFVNRTTPFI